jgi:hypothetical protein
MNTRREFPGLSRRAAAGVVGPRAARLVREGGTVAAAASPLASAAEPSSTNALDLPTDASNDAAMSTSASWNRSGEVVAWPVPRRGSHGTAGSGGHCGLGGLRDDGDHDQPGALLTGSGLRPGRPYIGTSEIVQL